ncbi:MAG: DUF983 domain-containing protein [Chitinophagales bacterium]
MFLSANPYRFGSMMKMPERCPVCNADFQREAGFYSAALWTSYPITIGIGAICVVLFLFVLHFTATATLILLGIVLLILQPLIMRTGRALLLNNFLKYDPNRGRKK